MLMKFKGLVIIVIITLCFFFIYNKINSPIVKERTLTEGQIAYGILDTEGKIIDNGSSLKLNSNIIQHTISLGQNLTEEREYLIIILVDFIQYIFTVNGHSYSSYSFILKNKAELKIDIEISLPSHAKEIDYLIIKKPNYLLEKYDFNKINVLQEILPIRFKISDLMGKLEYESDLLTITEGPNDTIFLSEDPYYLKPIIIAKSNEKAMLSIGNIEEEHRDYAVISFLDWKQQVFKDGKMVKYFNTNFNERQVLDIKYPYTDKPANYQVIALPKPYQVNRDDFYSREAYGTIRTLVKPIVN